MSITRLFDIAHNSLKKFPKDDVLATKYDGKWEKISTQQFVDLGDKFSRGLLKSGITKGDKIGLVSTNNRTEWCIADLGISQIGAISVPVYPTISEEDYVYIFNNAELKYCFVSDKDLYEKLLRVKEQVPSLVGIFTFDEVEGAANWSEILSLGEDKSNQYEVEDLRDLVNEDDVATIIYTSGTTGRPKGVMLSHKNIISNVFAVDSRIPKKKIDYKEIKTLSFLPICHVFERLVYLYYLYSGFSIYFAESIDKIGDNMKEVKPHYMSVVPRLLEKVYDKIYNKGISAGGLKKMIFLWALGVNKNYEPGTPKNLKQRIADKLVFSKWREGLGGNIITPLDNLDVKIDKDGEILVKGPSVMKGYYKNPEQTKEAFSEDGYFKTGDIGYIDDEGFLIITDRKKEMFKTSGGKYIAPQVIENMAKSSRFIEQIMVVGDGEKMPCALVQPDFTFVKRWAEIHKINIGTKPEEMVKSAELKQRIEKEIAKLNEKLGNWEQIKKIELTPDVWSVGNGMLTPTMKLRRKIIKEKYIDLYNKLYEKEA